ARRLPPKTTARQIDCDDKGLRLLVAYQHDHAGVDDWRTCHSVEVLEGTETVGPAHLAVVVVRDQSKFSEESHHAILVGRGSWRCRIIGFVCGLHVLAADITPP